MTTSLKTLLETRLAHTTVSIVGSVLITFTGLQLIDNYAQPYPAQSAAAKAVVVAAAPAR
jgi:hypothetical protein